MSKRKATVEQLEKRRFWKEHIETWRAGSLKQSQYCREHQLKMHRFIYWRKRFSCPGDTLISLVPVQISAGFKLPYEPKPSALRLAVSDKYKIEVERGFDPATLKQLIVTLGQL